MKKFISLSVLIACMLFVHAQTFTGGNAVSNTIVKDQTITSPVILDGVTNVQFINCKYSRAGFILKGKSSNITITNSILVGVSRFVDLSQATIPYATSGFALTDITIDSVVSDGGTIYQGTFGTYGSNTWAYHVNISRVRFTSNVYGPIVQAAGIYGFNFHDFNIRFNGIPTNGEDYGIFAINGGFGTINKVWRSGGWGWLLRGFLNAPKGITGTMDVSNTIDLNTSCYGSLEMRVEPAGIYTLTQGVNIRAVNNTAGNLKDLKFGNYSNAVVLIPNMVSPYTVEIGNNLSFNVQTKGFGGIDLGGNVGSFNNLKPTTLYNNLYFATYKDAGLTDDSTCNLLTTSPAIDAGITSFTKNDISGILRPQGKAYDIGARESGSFATPPCPTCPPINATTCAPFFPPVVVCPTCPPIPPQRKPVKIMITYDDGSITTSTLQ